MSLEGAFGGGGTISGMRAALRSLDSADAPAGLATLRPDDPENLAITICAVVGPSDGPGDELFYFTARTAKWLERTPPRKDFAFLHIYVLLRRWDFDLAHRAISDLCSRTEGQDWNEVGMKLSHLEAGSSRTTAKPGNAACASMRE